MECFGQTPSTCLMAKEECVEGEPLVPFLQFQEIWAENLEKSNLQIFWQANDPKSSGIADMLSYL